MSNARVAAAVAVAGSTALVGFVGLWEGTEYVPYRDIGGIWTVCDGVTGRDVIPGKVYTRAECRALTSGKLREHAIGLAQCIKVDLPEKVWAAWISWTYNVGVNAACGSSLVRLANAGDLEGACNQLTRWNRVGPKVVQGLTNRRVAELKWCLEGLQ